MKRITAILIVLTLILSVIPVMADTDEVWEPQISVSDFAYSKSSLSAGDMTVSCTLRKIDIDDGLSVPYTFVTVVKKAGTIVDIDSTDGVLLRDNEDTPELTVTIPEDTKRVVVESYFLDSLKGGKILAPKAVFNSADARIKAIYIDGERLESFNQENSETEFVFPASYAHTPDIKVIPENSAAKVTVSKVTSLSSENKTVVGIVVKVASNTVEHKLNLSLEQGSVTDAKMISSMGQEVTYRSLTTDIMRVPNYGTKADGVTPITPDDEGFSYATNLPIDSTYIYQDRDTFYYAVIPTDLIGATAVQTRLSLIRNNSLYTNKENALTEMGSFVIDRSADIYLFGGGEMDWAKAEGYVRKSNFDTKMASGSASLSDFTAYHKRVYVAEGETAKVIMGNAVNSKGSQTNNYAFAVKFIDPDDVTGLNNVSIEGVSDFEFNPDITEYTIELDEGTTKVPEITYSVWGLGATVTEAPATEIPGTTSITVKSGDGTVEHTYKFNFKEFETILTDLKVGGTTVEGFDKNIYEYTYALPFGWKITDGIPEVTASGSQYVDINIVQATADSMLTTVTVSSEKGIPKEYKITFEETLSLPSSLATLSFGYGKGLLAGSYSGSSAKAEDSLALTSYGILTNSDRGGYIYAYGTYSDTAVTTASGTYKPSVALLELDLSKLTDLDDTKSVTLYMYAGSKTNGGDAVQTIKIYDATGSVPETVTMANLRDISRWTDTDKLISENSYNITSSTTAQSIDITALVKKYYGTETKPVIAVYTTLEAQKSGQYVTLQLGTSTGSQTAIKYYKLDN